MKKKILIILAVLVLLGTIAYVYLNNVFFPKQVKAIAIQKAEEFLGRKVTIDDISLSLTKGIVVSKAAVYDIDDPQKIFVSFDRLALKIIFASFFKEKKVIIPNIRIENPYVFLARDDDGLWNFADISRPKGKTQQPQSAKATKPAVNWVIGGVEIENGSLDIENRSLSNPLRDSVRSIQAKIKINLKRQVQFDFHAQIPEQQTNLALNGNFGITGRKLSAHLSIENIAVIRYLPFAKLPEGLKIDDGRIAKADLDLSLENKIVSARGSVILENVNFQNGSNYGLKGNIKIREADVTVADKQLTGQAKIDIAGSDYVWNSEQNRLQGDIAADFESINLASGKAALGGNITTGPVILNIGSQFQLNSALLASNVKFAREGQNVSLEGDFELPQAQAELPNKRRLAGPAAFQQLKLEKTAEQTKLISEVKSENLDFILSETRNLKGQLALSNLQVAHTQAMTSVQAQGSINQAIFQIDAEKRFEGSPQADVAITIDRSAEAPIYEYSGSAQLANAALFGLPKIHEANNITGSLSFKNDLVETSKLGFSFGQTPVALSGSLKDFQQPSVDITVESESVDLAIMSQLFSDQLSRIALTVEGQAAVQAAYNGSALVFDSAKLKVSSTIRSASATTGKSAESFTGISGKINYEQDYLSWKDIAAVYKGLNFNSHGTFQNFKQPLVEAAFQSADIDIAAKFQMLPNSIDVRKFSGKFHHSNFDLKGNLRLKEEQKPDVDIQGAIALDFSDLGQPPFNLQEKLSTLNPRGEIALDGFIRGPLADWRQLAMNLKGKSSQLSLSHLDFDNFNLSYEQHDQNISGFEIASRLYGGEFTMNSAAELSAKKMPFQANVTITALDLAEFRKAKKIEKELSGKLSTAANLQGSLEDWRNMKGAGALAVTEGQLFQWKILQGLFKAILIPEFQEIVFNEAAADYYVENGKVLTQNLQLLSDSVSLNAKGWVDFDGNIDMNVLPDFSEITLIQSESLKKASTSFLTNAVSIKIAGTVQKPTYHVDSSALKLLGTTTDIITDGIKGVLDEIF